MDNFEPNIIAFCCHYCAYTAAETAGRMGLNYPSNVKVIRVPCSGRVDVLHIVKAFLKGADGVYVAGCLEGDCHFENGNIRFKKKVNYIKKILTDAGIDGERFEMVMMSAGMGGKFAEIAREFTEKIRKIGQTSAKANRTL